MANPPKIKGDTSSLKILLQYVVDEASARAAKESITNLENVKPFERQSVAINALSDDYAALQAEISKVVDPVKREAFVERALEIQGALTETTNDMKKSAPEIQKAYQQGAEATRQMTEEVKALNEESAKVDAKTAGLLRWGLTGFATMRTGRALVMVGKEIFKPIQAFQDMASKTDPVLRKWESATNRMSMSFARIGRVMMQEALPAMMKIADLAEKIAKYVEKHPELAKAAISIAGITTVLGGILVVLGQLMVSIVMMKGMQQGGALLGALFGMKGVAVAGTAAKVATAAVSAAPVAEQVMFMGHMATLSAVTAKTATQLGGFSGLMFALGTKVRMLIGIFTTLGAKILGFAEFLATGLLEGIFTVVGSVIGGLVVGLGVNELLSRTEAGKKAGIQPTGKIATVAAYAAGGLFGQDTAENWAWNVAKAFGYVTDASEESANALGEFGDAFDLVAKDATELYENFVKANEDAKTKLGEDINKVEEKYEEDRVEAVEDYSKKRSDIETQYAQERVEIEADYEKDRTRLVEDFARDAAKRQADYLRDQTRDIDDFNRDTSERIADHARAQRRLSEDTQEKLADLQSKYYEDIEDTRKDHLKKLEQLEKDHQFNVWELGAARDMLGLIMEKRRYEKEKSEAEGSYSDRIKDLEENLAKERERILEDYAERQAEMEENFATQEQRRREDFERKQAEAAEEFALEAQRRAEDHALQLEQMKAQAEERLKELDDAHKEQLAELEKDYSDELTMLKTEKAKQLAALRIAYERERKERNDQLRKEMSDLLAINQEGYTAMEEAARKYADALIAEATRLGVAGAGSVPKKSVGGYASGMVFTGEQGEEFILNRATTIALERALGGRLTQAGVLGALASDRRSAISGMSGGARQVSINQRFDFHGALTAAERTALRREMRQVTYEGVLSAIGGE